MRRLIALACLLLAITPVLAATPATNPPRLPLRHLGITQGLAQSSAQAITQDAQGYMWLGTQSGLQRFDGYDFTNFHHNPTDASSLAQNDVVALAAAPDGSLWVGTRYGGVDVLRPGKPGFEHHAHQPGNPASLASNAVFSLLVTHEGQVWVGTQSGLDRRQPDGTFRHYRAPTGQVNGNRVYTVFQGRHGQIRVGTAHGAYRYDRQRDRLQPWPADVTHFPDAARDALAGTINTFADMPDGNRWIGTVKGIVVVSDQGRFVRLLQHTDGDATSLGSNRVRAITRDQAGTVWVATYGGGLSRMHGHEHGFTTFRHDSSDQASLSRDTLFALFVDQTGLLWIGSQGGGIDIYNPTSRAFGSLRHPRTGTSASVDDLVWAIQPGAHHRLWAGTDAGLTVVDLPHAALRQPSTSNASPGLAEGNPVMALRSDTRGGLWIGTPTGLFHKLADANTIMPVPLGLPESNSLAASIRQIFIDSQQRLWVGTAWGLLQLDPDTGAVLKRFASVPGRADNLPGSNVSTICQTNDGTLWIGSEQGMRRFDGEHDRFSMPAHKPNQSNVLGVSDVLSCLPGTDGTLWVGTASGIVHFQPGKGLIRLYDASDGLSSQTIYSLLRDGAGSIWAGTDRGLLRLDPSSGRVRSYGRRDGLENEEFNQSAAYAGKDGELYFGGVDGITVVHPAQLTASALHPQVVIGSYTLIGRDGEQASTRLPSAGLTLNHRPAIVTFNVAVLDYTDPHDNFFRYRLRGFDDTWHTMRGRHSITFTNLDPGDYTLQVDGGGSDGLISPHRAAVDIHVLPPPWRTWWAWLLYACAAVALLGAGLYVFALWIRRQRDLVSEQQRRRWAEALQELLHDVTGLRDEREIAEHLIQQLPLLITHVRAVFYGETAGELHVLAQRGFPESELKALEQWPYEHRDYIERLRREDGHDPLLALDPHFFQSVSPNVTHFAELPFDSADDNLRLLVIGRSNPPFNAAEHDISEVLVRQMSVVLDRARLIRELAIQATTDSLTQVLNRRSILDRAQSEFGRARRYHEAFSLLLLDIDHFKAVNDTHGHLVGDDVLRGVVETCTQRLRESDSIGRYGGEEFVICLPQTDADSAAAIAERLREDIQLMRINTPTGAVAVTVSIGAAVGTVTDTRLDSLIARADASLYAAKGQGRNRVVPDGGHSTGTST